MTTLQQLCEPLEERIAPAVFIVNSTADDPNNPQPNTLRWAIQQANSLDGTDIIRFHKSTFGKNQPPQTILLDAPIEISSSIFIQGTGQNRLILDGQNTHRIFEITGGQIQANAVVSLSKLTLQNGNGFGSDFSNNNNPNTFGPGGAIYNTQALILQNVELRNNSSLSFGGALFSDTKFGAVVLNKVTFADNSAAGGGGGAWLTSLQTPLDIRDSTFTNNTVSATDSRGGGLYIEANGLQPGLLGPLTKINILKSNFTNNSATGNDSRGGGLFLSTTGVEISLSISKSLLTNNHSAGNGGAATIVNTATTANYNLANLTVSANTAGNLAGGLSITNATDNLNLKATLRSLQILQNSADAIGGLWLSSENSGQFFLLGKSIIQSNQALGNGTDPGDFGGIRISGAASFTISGASITNNSATGKGAGLGAGKVDLQPNSKEFSGILTIRATSLTNNQAGQDGGALFIENGILSASRLNLHSNLSSASGGAIAATDGASISILSSKFTANSASLGGGAVALDDFSSLLAKNSTFSTNQATGSSLGGAIHADNAAQLIIQKCSLLSNSAHSGAALYGDNLAQLQILNSNLSNNQALTGQGGALLADQITQLILKGSLFAKNKATTEGGALATTSPSTNLQIEKSRFIENSSNTSGGALALLHGQATISKTHFAKNSALISGGAAFVDPLATVSWGTRLRFNSNTAPLHPNVSPPLP